MILIVIVIVADRYLNGIVQLNYNLLRMLERYSKEKDHVFVRKKRVNRKKKKSMKEGEDY